ncbi:uncharacterized protein LOC122365409 [Amphibalanus amphitrite]|uniref:uncharacterized protein LOC122365409 n=1 Tax=Amphibalanus amphitrite TaxID=1232801 RepID=UPI001C92108B|nr:uncharacterized protein LOC122365409 [Amphibalanus amphitrite]
MRTQTLLVAAVLLAACQVISAIEKCGPEVNNGSHTWSQGSEAEWAQQGEFNDLNKGKPEWITNQVEVYCFGCMIDISRAGVATIQNSNCRCIRKRKLFQAVNAWYK